jgi:NAD(P)-dependent dehydrogenase (short-subunit alcohol dehydrogenase family)
MNGRTVVITGATSGIGEVAALTLAKMGARIILVARNKERADATLAQLRSRELGHEIGFGIGIAHGYATLGTIGFEGRFDYAAIGTVSNVASRLCDEAKLSSK